MASSIPLKDLQENFFLCPVCLDQFREPKSLPCLHRYCKECLETVIEASTDGTINCPQCKKGCVLPENGVDGFKTDFHMKSMLKFMQLQKSFENKTLEKCVSCLKLINASAYCFKCRDFLCGQCNYVHVTSKMFTDHRPRTLRLDNIEAKNITLDKLAAFTEEPVCHDHVKKEAHLCCSTCQNIPVCVACTYNKHKGHDLHDVTELSKTERRLLKQKLAEVNMYKSKLYEVPKKIQTTSDKLDENVAKRTKRLTNQYKHQAFKIKDKLEERKNVRRKGLLDIEHRRKDEEKQNNLNYEAEFKSLNKKYEDIRKTTTAKYDNECQQFKENCDEDDKELLQKLGKLESNFKSKETAKELLTEQNKHELAKILQYCELIIKRYENFTTTTSSILSSKNEWTDVLCIPDVKAACEPLIEEMKHGITDLQSLSDIVIADVTKVIPDDVTIIKHPESVVDVEEIQAKDWWVDGVTSNSRGDIVITGEVSGGYTHITVINRRGEVQRQDQIKRERNCPLHPDRYSCFLSEFKVATVCTPDEVGIYDIRDGSYIRKTISDVISDGRSDRCVLCVATDPVNNHIFTGTDSRYVYVFDDHLNYSHTITLPDVISATTDITVHGGILLICDYPGKRAYAVTIVGSVGKLMYEFTKPDLRDWRPWRVSKDKNGFIYTLWDANISGQSRCILVHYSQDDQTFMNTITVDANACCVDVMKVGEKEKVIIATDSSGKLYTYGLTVT